MVNFRLYILFSILNICQPFFFNFFACTLLFVWQSVCDDFCILVIVGDENDAHMRSIMWSVHYTTEWETERAGLWTSLGLSAWSFNSLELICRNCQILSFNLKTRCVTSHFLRSDKWLIWDWKIARSTAILPPVTDHFIWQFFSSVKGTARIIQRIICLEVLAYSAHCVVQLV